MRQNVDVPPFAPQKGEVGERRLRTRQDDQPGIARQWRPRPDQHKLDPRLGGERVEIVEIGDARQQGNGNFDASALTRRSASRSATLSRNAGEGIGHGTDLYPLPHRGRGGTGRASGRWVRVRERHRVFSRKQRCVCEIRYHAETAQTGALADRGDAAVEEADIAAELVDYVSVEPGVFARAEQRTGADEL